MLNNYITTLGIQHEIFQESLEFVFSENPTQFPRNTMTTARFGIRAAVDPHW